jgi:hypothetical protein
LLITRYSAVQSIYFLVLIALQTLTSSDAVCQITVPEMELTGEEINTITNGCRSTKEMMSRVHEVETI